MQIRNSDFKFKVFEKKQFLKIKIKWTRGSSFVIASSITNSLRLKLCLPVTPSYRIFRACRIYRRDVYCSMVSANPSSSGSCMLRTIVVRRRQSNESRQHFRKWQDAGYTRVSGDTRYNYRGRKSPSCTRHGVDNRATRTNTVAAVAGCTSRAFPPRNSFSFFCAARRLFLRDKSRFT